MSKPPQTRRSRCLDSFVPHATKLKTNPVFDRCAWDSEYQTGIPVKTKESLDLDLKCKNHYDEKSQTQFSPSIYELYNGAELLQSENMDFQTHLYRYGEMKQYLRECGFKTISTYATYQKEMAADDSCDMFLYECSK